MFVEYEDEKSINLVTRFMKKVMLSGIYLAGTYTFTRIFKSKKGFNKSRKARVRKIWNKCFLFEAWLTSFKFVANLILLIFI